MKLLILGGTQFVGLHLVQVALAGGHEVTLFNRGLSGRGLFPQVETLIGDRDSNLTALKGRSWDAVIDVSGYVPDTVRASAELLAHAVERYVYISSIMVYANYDTPMQDENSPLAQAAVSDGPAYLYGLQKAQCEVALEPIFGGRTLTIRPGFIAGPHDNTDRFTYWARRTRQGGEMLAPGDPEAALQFIDVRDLADFTIRMVEQGEARAFNVSGPARPLSWNTFMESCNGISGSRAKLTWVDATFLHDQGFTDWSMPLWPPLQDQALLAHCDCRRATEAGLQFRPLETTIHDTLRWFDAEGTPRAGLTPEREAELLRAWHSRISN